MRSGSLIPAIAVMTLLCLPALGRHASSSGAWGPKSSLVIWGEGDITNTLITPLPGAANSATDYNKPIIFNGGIGLLVHGNLYFGLRYEYWKFTYHYSLAGVVGADKLNYQTLGGELGMLIPMNDLTYLWIIPFCLSYPTSVSVSGAAGTYVPSTKPIGYSARIALGVRMASFYSVLFDFGYRQANLGHLFSGGTEYYSDHSSYNLSGPYGGVGLHFQF